jgi:hypothetical protein
MSNMHKHIYLIRGSANESYDSFNGRIAPTLQSISGKFAVVKMTITARKPPPLSIIPYRKSKISVVSLYAQENILPETSLVNMPGFSGLYRVTEALPVSYEKTWKDGEVTPGVCLLTLFRKKVNLDYATFLDRWHNGHTPLSLKIHPLWHYNRNVVDKLLHEQSEKFDGIVEEHCRTPSELFNPFKFFGHPLIVIPRMLSVYSDVKSFIDYSSIESYLVSEYYIKS